MAETHPALESCAYTEEVFGVLGKRWTGVLIDLLLQRPARFNELHAALPGLSKRVLSERLVGLQEVGLVERDVDPGPPITATYRLTERGRGLGPAMDALRRGTPRSAHFATSTTAACTSHEVDHARARVRAGGARRTRASRGLAAGLLRAGRPGDRVGWPGWPG